MYRNTFVLITILFTATAFSGCNPEEPSADPSCTSGLGRFKIENKASETVVISVDDNAGELDKVTLKGGATTTIDLPTGKFAVHAVGSSELLYLEHTIEISCDAQTTLVIPNLPEVVINLSFAGNASGTVHASINEASCDTSCANSFPLGAQITFTAVPGSQSNFGGWTGACAGASGTSCTVTADQAMTVGVVFLKAPAPMIVSTYRLSQDWGAGAWNAPSVVVSDVQAGDAIIVLGIYWASTFQSVVAPVDSNGQFLAAVDQVPAHTGNNDGPPVFAQIFYELDAAAGTHVITPPNVGATDGDGTLYVVQVRNLHTLLATGQTRVTGAAIPSVAVDLSNNVKAGDFVVAIGGYDNVAQFPNAGITDPPAGWQSLGAQQDGANNVPSEACARRASEAGNQAVTWTWTDTGADVAVGAVAAFR